MCELAGRKRPTTRRWTDGKFLRGEAKANFMINYAHMSRGGRKKTRRVQREATRSNEKSA